MKKSIEILVFSIVVFSVSFFIITKAVAESYSFVEFETGSFFDACHINECAEPDGKLPAYLSFGHKWLFDNTIETGYKIKHRSNLDIGWPVKGDTGTEEYDRNGLFVFGIYKFNHRP